MAECRFKFPLLNGGRRAGLNDAGIETFKSNPLGALARECAQNSLDAGVSKDSPARLVFKFHEIALKDIPGSTDLKDAFESCKQYWSSDRPEYKFSDRALSFFGHDKISVIEISDYNTTGLPGEDDETGSPWDALVMSAGQCNKDSNAGGGFGIGKSAPFAVSAWRTVFYSSLTPDGKYAFRGVCCNMTHLDASGKRTQGVGFYGYVDDDNYEIVSIRNPLEIPEFFRRSKPGTSIYVLAFSNEADYQDKLKHAVLENFWPAIYFNKICFDINGEEIDKENLAEHMAHDDGLKLFMQCLEGHDKIYAKESVGPLGECELYFIETNEKRQNIVCTRSSRMKIQSLDNKWKLDGIGFVGLFSCLSEEGNRILKNMEPPEHSKWEYKRSNDEDDVLSESDRKKILRDTKDWIRSKIYEQVKKGYTDETDLEDASRYFKNPINESGDTAGGETNHDGFASSVKSIKVKKILTSKQKHAVDSTTAAGGEAEDNGVAIPAPDGSNKGGGKGAVRAGETGGSPGNKQAGNSSKIKIAARGFVLGDEYVLTLKPKAVFNGELLLLASGEDEAEKLEIAEARTDVESLPVQDGKITKISLSPDSMCKIYIKTQEKEYFSVEVIGYESN